MFKQLSMIFSFLALSPFGYMQQKAFSSSLSSFRNSQISISSLHTDVLELSQFIKGKSHLVTITGAGVSTNSGIPDYRGKMYRL